MLAGPVATSGALPDSGTPDSGTPDSGNCVPYRDYGDPDSIALDLALAAAGYDPQPLPARPWPPEGGPEGPELAVEPAPGRFAPAAEIPAVLAGPVGGARVLEAGEWRRLGAVELVRSATEAFGSLPRAPRRDILVLHRSLAEPAQRLLLTWAALTDSALILLPRPESSPAEDDWYRETLAWVRPTLLHGTAAELTALRRELDPRFRRRWPWHRRPRLAPPLDRVRGVMVLGGEELAEDETSFWQTAGVPVVAVSNL